MTPHEVERIRYEGLVLQAQERSMMAEIVRKVSRERGITVCEIMGTSKRAPVALARHIAVYRCRRDIGLPHSTISKFFGYADHTTSVHACARIEAMGELH